MYWDLRFDLSKREGHMDPVDALESGQVKRFFRTRQKLNAPGVISHITQRASGADRLFQEEDDCLEMLARLKRVSQTHELEFMAFVLMPNHVHLLVTFFRGTSLDAQCYSWKHYTATKLNRALGQHGRFWQDESFDHLVRSERHFEHYQQYIAQNTQKANLCEGEYLLYRLEG